MKSIENVAIVIPVHNEEESLIEKINELHNFVVEGQYKKTLPRCKIIIADNNSSDGTGELGRYLEKEFGGVHYNSLNGPGKGFAIRETWLDPRFESDAYTFMDVDLATDLDAFPKLLEGLDRGFDVSIGSRYALGANVIGRSCKRKIISLGYRAFAGFLYGIGVGDFQCGFKAINRDVRNNVLPFVRSDDFAFDTELLVKAFCAGYSINQVPVKWTDDLDSRVNMKRDIPKFLRRNFELKSEQFRGILLDGIKKKGC